MTFLLIDFELPVHSYKPRYHSSRGRGRGEGGGGGGPGVTQREKTYFMNNDKHLFSIKQCRDNHLYEKQICWVGVSGLKQLKEMIYMPTRADTC